LNRLNGQEERHHAEMQKKNDTINDLRETAIAREQAWQNEKKATEDRHCEELKKFADELERRDKLYREELTAEKDRNAAHLKKTLDEHNRLFSEQEARFG